VEPKLRTILTRRHLICRTYENTSFEKVDIIKLTPEDPYQLVAISWFGEQDFLDTNIDALWDDITNVTKSTPIVTPGELDATFYP
jgi:hypothetical protein